MSENKSENNKKSIIKSFIRISGNLALMVISLQIIFVYFILKAESDSSSALIKKVSQRVLTQFDTLNPKDYLNYSKDIFYSLSPFSKKLPRIDLSIKINELIRLDCNRKNFGDGFDPKCAPIWNNGLLISDKEKFRVKLRAKGDRLVHRKNFRTMSFKVDIKGDKRFKGMEEFSLQAPFIRNYLTEPLMATLLMQEDIISPRNKYVRLFVNGEYLGIRHLEETYSKELIENNRKRYGPVFTINENVLKKGLIQFKLHDFNYWKRTNLSLVKDTRTLLEKTKYDQKLKSKYIDVELWAKYFAFLDAFNMFHGTYIQSVKFYLNPVTGLIEPAFFDGHMGATPGFSNYSFYMLHKDINDFCRDLCGELQKTFYATFFGEQEFDSEFYSKYLNNLEKVVSEEYFDNKIKILWKEFRSVRGNIYREFWRKDNVNATGFMPHIDPFESLTKRFLFLRQEIKTAREVSPIFKTNTNNKNIIVQNKFSEIPQVLQFECNGEKSEKLILERYKNKSLNLEKLKNCKEDNIYWTVNEFKTKKLIIDSYVLNSNFADKQNKVDFPSFYNKKISFKSGINQIDKDWDITKAIVNIENNAIICISNDANLYIKESNVYIHGEQNNSVKISNCDPSLGSGSLTIEKSKVQINNLLVSNLIEPKKSLRLLYGGINFINSELKINKLSLLNIEAEDSVNFINSNVNAKNISVSNSLSDGIDSDFSVLNIENITCSNTINDCLDLSYSKGKIGYINGKNIGDKFVSVGESSSLKINKAELNESRIGLVSKDSSKLNVEFYKFNNVEIPLSAFVKKREFSFPTLTIKEVNGEMKNILFSSDSILKINNKKYKSQTSSENIYKILYSTNN